VCRCLGRRASNSGLNFSGASCKNPQLRSTTCLVRAPEICVEVLSVSNTPAEIAEKIALYFEAGAQEVWTCDLGGTLEFHFSTPPEVRQASEICPKFPSVIRFSGE
jgi:Uma2 family endonuclease